MKQTSEHIEKRKRFGADHYNWKGGRMHHGVVIKVDSPTIKETANTRVSFEGYTAWEPLIEVKDVKSK